MTDGQIASIEQFRAAIMQKNLAPPETIIADGKIHRFPSNGKQGDDAGWYVLHDGDIPAGAFGDWRTGVLVPSWRADIGRELTPAEKGEHRRKQQQIHAAREEEKTRRRAEARRKAANMLKHSTPAPGDHPYLVKKGVASHGLKAWKNLLLIPMYDDTGEVQSLQMISGDGGKKFLSGGKMQGCYYILGNAKDADTILIAEGYATAATIHEATGLPVVVAYNAGNLLPVARAICAQNPNAALVFCADDDARTQGNPGMAKAADAAQAVDGKVIVPVFGDNRPDGATDFNDMAAHLGQGAVAGFFQSFFGEAEPPRQAEASPETPEIAAIRPVDAPPAMHDRTVRHSQ